MSWVCSIVLASLIGCGSTGPVVKGPERALKSGALGRHQVLFKDGESPKNGEDETADTPVETEPDTARINELIEEFQNPGVRWRRRETAETLGELGSEEAVPALLEFLSNPEDNVYTIGAVVEALGKIGSMDAVPALIQMLAHPDPYVRSITVQALTQIVSEAHVSVLIDVLQDENLLIRSEAARVLGMIGSDAAVPALIEVLGDENFYVYTSSMAALEKIGSETTVAALIAILQNENPQARKRAAEVLGKIGSETAIPGLVAAALGDEDPFVRPVAGQALGNIGSEMTVPMLIEAMQQGSHSLNAVRALGYVSSDESIYVLIELLQHEDYVMREAAARSLEMIGSEATVRALIDVLHHQDDKTRVISARILGDIGVKREVHISGEDKLKLLVVLQDVLKSENFYYCSIYCYESGLLYGNLFMLMGDDAVDEVVRVHSQQDVGSPARRNAIYALSLIRSVRSTAALINMLEGEGAYQVIYVLSDMKEKSLPILGVALHSENRQVRSNACQAVENILGQENGRSFVGAMEGSRPDNEILFTHEISEDRRPATVAALKYILMSESISVNVRVKAVDTLGFIGDISVVSDVIAVADGRAQPTLLRTACLSALGRLMESNEVTTYLHTQLTEGGSFQSEIIEALGNSHRDTTAEVLSQVFESSDRNERELIIQSLGEMGSWTLAAVQVLARIIEAHSGYREPAIESLSTIAGDNSEDSAPMAEAALAELSRLARSDDSGLSEDAIGGLSLAAQFNPQVGVPVLIDLLGDANENVSMEVSFQLSELVREMPALTEPLILCLSRDTPDLNSEIMYILDNFFEREFVEKGDDPVGYLRELHQDAVVDNHTREAASRRIQALSPQ